jgi:hypothetical protein
MNHIGRTLGLSALLVFVLQVFVSTAIASNFAMESTDPVFNVTAGLSGTWYDPTHDGEGYVLEVSSSDSAVVYWFTYDKQGKQRWMIGIGAIQGSRIIFDELLTTGGAKFGPDFDPADVEYTTWGTLELAFTGCDSATATYTGPPDFGSGSLSLQRLSRISGQSCDGSYSPPPVEIGHRFVTPGFSGSWYHWTRDGEGFALEVLDQKTALVFWFTYDMQGNQAWMLTVGEIFGTRIMAGDVLITSGGKFGPDFNSNDVIVEHWGSATFRLDICATPHQEASAGDVNYVPPPDFGSSGVLLLDRLSRIDGLTCD